MSVLTIYPETSSEKKARFTDFETIASKLKELGVQFERWTAAHVLDFSVSHDEILKAYAEPIQRLKTQYGFQAADVVAVKSVNADMKALREKFLNEHTHSEFEVRFFVGGCGLFYLHVGDQVFSVLCEQGDLLSVPANVTHWFDMGEAPHFACIRLFTNPEGWVADFTGSEISKSFPMLEELRRELAA